MKKENKLSPETRKSITYPLVFMAFIWMIKVLEVLVEVDFKEMGILPRHSSGLIGILTAPLIHGDFGHLASNSFPLLFLSAAIIYFYKGIAWEILMWIYLLSGTWVWIAARESYHIGASGLIYGMAAFLFLSGILRKAPRLMAISMVVLFLYGGLVWGVLPIKEGISWEGHLFGGLAGIILAVFFRKQGPQRKKYDWEYEEDDEGDEDDKGGEYLNDGIVVNYDYISNKKRSSDD